MPRRRSRLLLPSALAAAVAVAAVVLLRPGGGALAPDADGAAAEAEEGAGGDAGLVAHPTTSVVEAPVARGRAFIEGVVRRKGLPAPARVVAHAVGRAGAGVPASWLEGGTDALLPATSVLAASPAATAAAGDDGRFRLGPLDPGSYEVSAVAADGARGDASTRVPADGCVVGRDVDLRWGPERLEGRTMRADGTPWRGMVGAYAAATWETPAARGLALVATDDEGRFALTGLERGAVRVVAFVDRTLAVTSPPVTVPHAGPEWAFVVDAGVRELAGRVVDDRDGRPLAGASVLARGAFGDGQLLRARAVADAEGRWRAKAAGTDPYATATMTGYVLSMRHVGEGQAEVDFRLVRAARVHGRVLSATDGAALAGVPVFAVTLRAWGDLGARAVSGPDGRYELPEVAPGSVMVAAFGGGWWSRALLEARPGGFNPLVVEVKPDSTLEQDVVVSPAARATGKVVDAGGAPVVGAVVGWTGSPAAGSSLYDFDWAKEASRTATTEGGAFAVDSLVPGFTYTFQAAAVGQSGASAGPLEASEKTPLAVELRFTVPRWLDATVEDAGGRSVAGAVVQAWFQSFGNDGVGAQAVVDERGHARVGPLPQGDVWVLAHEPGRWNGNWVQVGAPEGEGATDPNLRATLTLTRTAGVHGCLVYPDGAPVSDRAVTLQLTGPDVNWSSTGTLSDGRFAFDGVAEAPYHLEVRFDTAKPPVAEATVQAGAEETKVVVPAEPAQRTLLEVVDGEGKPVPQMQVLHAGTDESAGTALLYDGRWKVPASSGEAWLELHTPASPAGAAIPWAPQTVGPIAADAAKVAVKLEPERRVEGVVRGPDGRGVRGVRVRALPTGRAKAFEGNDTPHDAALTDAEGRFRLGRLWAGEYRLFVEAAETYAPCEPVTVQAGASSVEVTLLQGLVAAVPVLDWRGRPLPKATVTASIEGRQSVHAVSDAAGVARLVGLDRARSYRLEVEVPEGGENLGVVVDPWKPSEEPVRVRRAAWVAGVLRDGEGRPVGGAQVTLVGEGDDTNEAETEADGRFRFEPVAPGDYRLFAATSGTPRRVTPFVTATAGGRDVTLALEPALDLKVRFDGMPASDGDVWASLLFDGTGIVAEAVRLEGAVAHFQLVHPEGTYAVYLRLDADPTRIAYRRRIAARAGELVLSFETTRSIRGRLVAPKGATGFALRATLDGVVGDVQVDADGRFEVRGLPDGTAHLHGSASVDGAQWAADIDAPPGGTLDVELRAR